MTNNPRVLKAFKATRALGIPDRLVKPVLKNLLAMYDKNWELIEEDNYRTLVDAYFESQDDKVFQLLFVITLLIYAFVGNWKINIYTNDSC